MPADAARLAAAAQRPITDIAFSEPTTEPAWKTIPSWFVYGDRDTAIPPKLRAFMAERARPPAPFGGLQVSRSYIFQDLLFQR